MLGEFDRQRNVAFFRSGAESSAVNQENRRERAAGGVAGTNDIHCLRLADGGVLHLALQNQSIRNFRGILRVRQQNRIGRQQESGKTKAHRATIRHTDAPVKLLPARTRNSPHDGTANG